MKNQYRIIFALCVTALFASGLAFGATNLPKNLTDLNETKENETNATEIALETGNASVMPVNTTVAPATPSETAIVPAASIPKPSPGFGIVAIAVVLSTIYINRKRK
ncbi:MAG: hypothetical protein OIN85_02990 [Candidatus Methanoperedens sp.]|nr:hypothetical protein [Candidatus Methanoperedens sp.]